MTWDDIDTRLASLGRDREWLAQATRYSLFSIRDALGPSSKKRSDRMLAVLTRAILDEQARRLPGPREVRPGIFEIFENAEQLDMADRASRVVGAPSIAAFCRDVVLEASEAILEREARERGETYPDPAAPGLKVAHPDPAADPTGSSGAPNPVESTEDPCP